jgi:uncharacterized protein (TIGR02246 family)
VQISPADWVAVNELVARYNRAIDTGDVEGWVGTFAPDGVFDGVIGRFEGEEALRRLATDYWTTPAYEPWRGCQHWVNNVVVESLGGTPERARLRCDHAMIKAEAGGARVVLLAAYDDELVRLDGGWRFARRTVRAFPPEG